MVCVVILGLGYQVEQIVVEVLVDIGFVFLLCFGVVVVGMMNIMVFFMFVWFGVVIDMGLSMM